MERRLLLPPPSKHHRPHRDEQRHRNDERDNRRQPNDNLMSHPRDDPQQGERRKHTLAHPEGIERIPAPHDSSLPGS